MAPFMSRKKKQHPPESPKNQKRKSPSPLHTVAEKHLLENAHVRKSRDQLISGIVSDYLSFLRKNHVSIPSALEAHVVEELQDQVQSLLAKKTYGCMGLAEYQRKIPQEVKKEAKRRYSKLKTKAG